MQRALEQISLISQQKKYGEVIERVLSGGALGSWPISPPGSTTSVFGKPTLEQPSLICHTPIPAIPPWPP